MTEFCQLKVYLLGLRMMEEWSREELTRIRQTITRNVQDPASWENFARHFNELRECAILRQLLRDKDRRRFLLTKLADGKGYEEAPKFLPIHRHSRWVCDQAIRFEDCRGG